MWEKEAGFLRQYLGEATIVRLRQPPLHPPQARPRSVTITDPGSLPVVDGPDGELSSSTVGAGTDAPSRTEAAGLFHRLIERSPDAVVVSRRVGGEHESTIVLVNDTLLRLLGIDEASIVGKPTRVLLGPDADQAAIEQLEQLEQRGLRAGERVVVEAVLRGTDGTTSRVEATYEQVPGVNDDQLLLATYRDLEAGHAAAAALWRNEEWAQAITRGISDVMLVTNAEGIVTWVSPSVQLRLGFAPESVHGTSVFDYLHPDDLEAGVRDFAASIEQGSDARPVEVRVRHLDGTYRTVLANGSELLDHPAINGIIMTLSDVSERAEAERRLRHSEQWAQRLVAGGSDLVLVMDREGVVTFATPAVEWLLGYTIDEFVGQNQIDVIHPDDRDAARRAFFGARPESDQFPIPGQLPVLDQPPPNDRSLSPSLIEIRARTKSGDWRILDLLVTPMLDDPVVDGVVVNIRDVTTRRRAEELLAEQADLLEAIARGAPLEITLQKITQMIEHSIESSLCAIGMLDTDGTIRVRAAPSLPRQVVNLLDEFNPRSEPGAALRDSGPDVMEYPLATDERFRDVSLLRDQGLQVCRVASLLAPGSGELLGALTVFHRSTDPLGSFETELLSRARNLAAIAIERRRFESTLEYQALYDNLTGLPNRTLLLTRIEDALRRAERVHTGVAVLFVDLDRFKVINDSVGHALGDQLLQLVAERLREPLRPGDTLGRFGGDKYMVVCNRVADEAAALAAADRFGKVLLEPFRLGAGEIFITTSVGISFAEDATVSAEQMIRNADVAMYRAKAQGRNQHAIFEAGRDQRKVEQLALEQALRHAIEAAEFELHFQPAVRLSDGAMNHVEALVRWHRPGHGMVMPGLFIPLAEETGLIVPLGWWVLERACEVTSEWPLLPDGESMQVAVNLSARQLAAPELHDVVTGVLARTGLDPSRLCFEVTESDLVHDVDRAIAALEDLKLLGVQIAIDDFGTGYASLEYIRHFTMADYLKIDRSFVDGMEKPGSQERAIVTAAIAMAKSLGLKTVAEGVETEEQAAGLRELECELAQGYLFSRPIPAAECIALTTAPRG